MLRLLVGDAAAVGGGFALGGALLAEKYGYHFKKFFAGAGAGCVLSAALAFSVASGLPQKQSKAPVAGPVRSTLHIESRGGELCKNFNVAETTDAAGRLVYILTVPDGCTVPAAAAAVPR